MKIELDINKDFFKEETKCDYLIKSDMKKLWGIQIDLLNKLDLVCKKHDIKYFVMYGTLLGAVRHQGFIPWDDDIDVVFTRKEFEKLRKVSNEFNYPYFLQTEHSDKGSHTYYAKLRNSETTGILKPEIDYGYKYNQGIFIDVFIFDNIPDDENESEKFRKRILKLRRNYFLWARLFDAKNFSLNNKVFKILKPLIILLRGIVKAFKIPNLPLKKFEKEVQKYDNIETKRFQDFGVFSDAIFDREWFSETVYLDFEMLKVPCPKCYDEVLKKKYKDYMKFVIGTEAHSLSIMDVDKTYKEYWK